jgi:tetratricopeptide (TPR) repeat protein
MSAPRARSARQTVTAFRGRPRAGGLAPSPRGRRPPGPRSALIAALLCCAAAPRAAAQSPEAARLRTQAGHDFERYVAARRADPASPSLARACEGYRASLEKEDDAGTRIDLANCYSAMRRYELAHVEIARAREAAEAQAQRAPSSASARQLAAEARDHQARIYDRAPHFRVDVGAPESSDLDIFYDGRPLPHERWGKALVMDDGEHEVAAQAPGAPRWSTKIRGKAGGPPQVVVPPLHQNPSSRELAKFCGDLGAAAEKRPGPRALLSLANCHSAMGKYQRSSLELAEAQRRAHEAHEPRLVEEAEREREYIARAAPHLLINVRAADRPGLAVFFDGAPLSHERLGQPLPADIGEHEVAAQAPGSRRWSTRVRGGLPAVAVVVPRLSPGSAATPPPAPHDPPKPSWERPALGYVFGGLGVAALGVGAAFGLMAASSESEARRVCSVGHCADRDKAIDLLERAGGQARVADVSLGLGLLGVAAGGYLLFVSPSTPKASAGPRSPTGVAIAPGVGGFVVQGRF